MATETRAIFGGPTRATFGITVTLRCLATGNVETRHITGPPRAALQELAAELDARTDGVWVVQVYSTPQTIYNDLVRGHDYDPTRADCKLPEWIALGQIGRHDLCAPELLGHAADGRVASRSKAALRRQAERLAVHGD